MIKNLSNMDLYYEIKEIKERQETMLSKIDTLLNGSSQEKLYDLADLTNLLKVSKRTVFTWLKQGTLPHSRVGGKIWITEEQLKLFLEQNVSNHEVTNYLKRN